MIIRFLVWLMFAIIGLCIIVLLLPFIVLLFIAIAVMSLFSRSRARIWLSRAKAGTAAGAQTVRDTMHQHAATKPPAAKKAGQRKSAVVDAHVVDVSEDRK